MHPAAPLLFRHAPSCLPICEAISTIVWVCWTRWRCWHHWWQDRNKWRCSGRAPTMVDSAAPLLLVSCPSIFCIHSAIEWVHWPRRHRTCRWRRLGGCRWRRGWWRGRWRRERSWWNCHRWFWQSGGGPSGGTTSAHSSAAVILLRLGPCGLPHQETLITIVDAV